MTGADTGTAADAVTGVSVGFVGLGNMGHPMAGHLVEAGHSLVVRDVAPAPQAAFLAAWPRARAAGHARPFAEVEALVLMLPDSTVVEAVLDGAVEQLPPGCLVIDMSSSEPQRTRVLAARLREAGLAFVDAPVSGGVRGARAGTLTALVGGSPADVARARPLIESMARTVVHVGDVGAGHAAKALNNLVSAASVSVTVEALHLAERFGIDPRTMTDVLNSSSGRSNTSENKVAQFMLDGSYGSGFSLRLMAKDVAIALGLAGDEPPELSACVAAQWRRVADGVDPAVDHTEMYRLLEPASGGAR